MLKPMKVLMIYLALMPLEVTADQLIQDLMNQPVPLTRSGEQPSLDQVQLAIIAGCRIKGWSPVEADDYRVRASILVRGRHYAEVEIPYSRESYSIIYKNSRNLDYDAKKRKIHRNYNKWVVLLSRAIQGEFAFY